jgi:chorismate mutase
MTKKDDPKTAEKKVPTIDELRAMIDEVDRALLMAIGLRQKLSKNIGILKKVQKSEVVNPLREEEVKALWKKRAVEQGVRPELALMTLDFLLSESRRIQEEECPPPHLNPLPRGEGTTNH